MNEYWIWGGKQGETRIVFVYAFHYKKQENVLERMDPLPRSKVVEMLDAGHVIRTCLQQPNGKYKPMAKVAVYDVGGERFIKTEANNTKADNLGEITME